MKIRRGGIAALAVATFSASTCLADVNVSPVMETKDNITFGTWPLSDKTSAGYEFGMALPENAFSVTSPDFIGFLRCAASLYAGWCGVSLGQIGGMVGGLLVVAWPTDDQQVLMALRTAPNYQQLIPYSGDATVSVISSTVTDTYYEVVFNCKGCLRWQAGNEPILPQTLNGFMSIGWASSGRQSDYPDCPSKVQLDYHNRGHGTYAAVLRGIESAQYEDWDKLPAKDTKVNCTGIE